MRFGSVLFRNQRLQVATILTSLREGYRSNEFADYSQCLPGSGGSSSAAAPPKTTQSTLSTATRTSAGASPTTKASQTTSQPAATNSGNPLAGKTFYANPYYSSEIVSLAAPSLVAAGSTALAAKATKVAEIGTFYWL